MMAAELAVETLAYSPLTCLTRLIAREHFIQFSRRESFKLIRVWMVTEMGLFVSRPNSVRFLFVGLDEE
jgi:hypothetical protein